METGCVLISLLVAFALSGILMAIKFGVPIASMGLIWVFLPIIIWMFVLLGLFFLDGADL